MSTPNEVASKRTCLFVILGAALGMFAGFPPLFNATAGVFMQPLSAAFHWGRSETALSYSSSMLGLALVSPLVGYLMDRFGVRRVILISAVLFSLCVAAMSLQSGSKAVWVGLSLLIGIFGAATSVLGYLAILPQWFDHRLGLALALAMSGLGAGTIIMPVLTQSLISAYGWRTAYVALGLGSMAVSVFACLLLRERGKKRKMHGKHHSGRGDAYDGVPLAEALRSWKLWLIFSVFVMASMATLSLNPHFPAMFVDKGFSAAEAARTASLTGVGLITGRLITGVLLDRVHASYVACLFFLVGAGGLILVKISGSYPALLLACAMIGLAIGAEGDLISYLIRSYFGLRAFGTLYGIAFAGYAFGGVVGPVAVGRLFDSYQSYDAILAIFPWMLIVAGLALLALGKYRSSSMAYQTGAASRAGA